MSQLMKYAGIILTVVTVIVVCYLLAPSVLDSAAAPSSPNQNGLFELGNQWQRDVELTHAADQYDCLESATKRMAAQLAAFMLDRQGLIEDSVTVEVRCEGEHLPSDFAKRVVSALELFLPLALLDSAPHQKVQFLHSMASSTPSKESTESSFVELRLTTLSIGANNDPELNAGRLLLAGAIYFDQQVTAMTPLQIASKDWIGRWNGYRSSPSHQHFRQYRAETLDQARRMVARELASVWQGQGANQRLVGALSRQQATTIILQQLTRLDLVVDQFEQTFQLTMQDGSQLPALARSALLVDQSPPKLEAVWALLDTSSQRASKQFWRSLGLLVSVASILLAVTFGLDRLTLGYYTWRIRGGAVLIATVLVLMLV
jgi:hypothetical protein